MVKGIFCHNKDLITQTILEILVLGARDRVFQNKFSHRALHPVALGYPSKF